MGITALFTGAKAAEASIFITSFQLETCYKTRDMVLCQSIALGW